MWEPYDEGENEARWRLSRQRTTPLLARPTPLLRDARAGGRQMDASATGTGEWLPQGAEWSGPLPVPPGQRHLDGIIGQRLASIEAVPYDVLEWSDRRFLLHWIRRGYPVYAYRAPTGHWNLWLDYWRVALPLPEHLRLMLPSELFADEF